MPEQRAHLQQLAANIRAAREAAGLSQVQLAQRSGVDLSFLNEIETQSQTRDPTTWTLLRIARALKTTPADLLDGVE